ncbi:MAG: diacylglycerol kinase [Candidatus Hydrogenedentes bacterium]|nr:diacylglycerol kinase [Candidatus Hydrogenedentota bacterium]
MPNKFLAKEPHVRYNPARKLRHAFNGFWFAVVNDFSVAYKVVVSVATLTLAAFYAESVDVLLILVATGLMMMAELFNTAIEAICDYFETGHDEKIGAIKDIAAAAAGVCIIVWVVVIVTEMCNVFM